MTKEDNKRTKKLQKQRKKKKKMAIRITYAQKAFNKIRHPFMIKTLN